MRWLFQLPRAIAASLTVAFTALVAPVAIAGPVAVLWTLFCAITILVHQRTKSGLYRRFCISIAVIAILMAAGNVLRGLATSDDLATGGLTPADALQLPAYIAIAVTAWRLFRARSLRRQVDAWLDAAAISLATFLFLWSAFLGDFILDAEISLATRYVNGAYNALSLTAFAIVLRISATPGKRPTSYQLLGVGYLAGFLADVSSAVSIAEGAGVSLAIALSPVAFGLTTAALLHPSAPEVFRPHVEAEQTLSAWRILILAAASATPLMYLVDAREQSAYFRIVALFCGIGLATVVFSRLLRLLQSEMETAQRDRNLASHLSSLAGLAPRAIVDSLDEIAENLIPEIDAQVGCATDTAVSIPLDDVLQFDGRNALILSRTSSLEPQQLRSLQSLVREAGLIAQSSEARAVAAKAKSEAEANRRIAANERRFRALVQNASDVVLVLNPAGKVTYMSDAAVKVLGYETSAYVGKSLDWVVHENDWGFAQGYMDAFLTGTSSHLEHEIRAVHLDGSIRLLDLVLTDMRHVEGIEGIVINITDVTEKRRLESNLRDAETTDPLTMQLNRTAFIREIDTALRRTSISASSVSLAIVNLDDFRLVNEGYGTVTADQVLIEVAHRIRQSVRLNDIVARLNGDEFGILMPDGYSAFEAERVVQRILEDVTEPITTNGRSISLRATAGLVLNGDGSATGIDMLRDADTALDTAKSTSRGSVVLFEEAMGKEASERIELRNLLKDALATKKLRLAYQPIVDIETGEIASLEALSRWQDDSRGNISPATFIPIAESAGMITELGEWALRTACEQVVEWARLGYDHFTVSVNMSGHQLREENVITKVSRILKETKVDPARITIEITESVLIDDTDFIAHRIRALRELGLRLAIDDFGTGYSSLSYLRRYEFDVLKIDRSFVIPLADDANKREREIVNAMIKLAQALGAITVAEGIEEAEEYGVLRTLGCDLAQGYLLWYPMESYEVIAALNVVPNSAAA